MIFESAFVASTSLILYHHLGYPLALNALTGGATCARPERPSRTAGVPSISVIVPAFNEERFIADKIRECARLESFGARTEIVVVCDGCTDQTVRRAADAIATLPEESNPVQLIVHEINRGKVAVLNEAIAACRSELIALTDASASLPRDALTHLAEAFADPDVGFGTGAYRIPGGSDAQQAYWRYQTEIKRREAALGSPIGAHGAFYAFRRSGWTALEADTINDDVILPMRIVEDGYRGVYDPAIVITEAERDAPVDDLARRERLGAGAMQQVLRLWRLANPRRPGLAFAFLSGKALRALMPFFMAAALVSSFALSFSSGAWGAIFAAQLALYGLALSVWFFPGLARLPGLGPVTYLVSGYAMSGLGALRYLAGGYRRPWTRVGAEPSDALAEDSLDAGAIRGKRVLDIVVASFVLVALVVLFLPIAIAIKWESPGRIFYRQLRVGLRTRHQSNLFYLTKFRTMRADAEARSGAVWATDRDPRITRVGNFLRKTRLDELPQCIDVLRGQMSVVGPRPERPQFFSRLEREIPFYAERTYGVKPGITGLAQVFLPYDTTIEDVREKVLHDHAYALRLTAPGLWLRTDLEIIFRTFAVMVLGKGR